jgi:hypothetical protein
MAFTTTLLPRCLSKNGDTLVFTNREGKRVIILIGEIGEYRDLKGEEIQKARKK